MQTREKWARRVAKWKASGQTSPDFCADKPFTPPGLRFWAHRLRQETKKGRRRKRASPALRISRVVRVPARGSPPVRAAPSPSGMARPASSREQAGAAVDVSSTSDAAVVVAMGAAVVTVRPGVDRATLTTVFEALVQTAQTGGVR